MQTIFQPGNSKTFTRVVRAEDCTAFESGLVHPVYATFALARDAEWCCRLFVLEMKEEHEEGIGTMIHIEHISPAPEGAAVVFTAVIKSMERHEIICSFEARTGDHVIARGEQGQKILPKDKLAHLFARL